MILVSHGLPVNSYPQCLNFNNNNDLGNICGYNETMRFREHSYLNSSYERLQARAPFGNCSNYGTIIHCSSELPRCREDLDGPYLPCKRVCDEYLKKCPEEIFRMEYEDLFGFCDLLPEYDDPNSTEGFLGRCFVPDGFKASAGEKISITKSIKPCCM